MKIYHRATLIPTYMYVLHRYDMYDLDEKPTVLFERHCHATVKSEAIACARRCLSSRLTGW
jgi:hypothetical protein